MLTESREKVRKSIHLLTEVGMPMTERRILPEARKILPSREVQQV